MNGDLCRHQQTLVVNASIHVPAGTVRRLRKCKACGQTFTTYEQVRGAC